MLQQMLQQNISLRKLNTFGIDVNAQYFAEVFSEEDLMTLLTDPFCHSLNKLVLGGGSNILLTTDFPGLIIKNSLVGFQVIAKDSDHIWLEVGAGEIWHQLVLYCIARNYGGLENLSLIPGKVGAAPIQNIGAYGAELADVLVEITAFDLSSGQKMTFQAEECQFGYRDSIFKHAWSRRVIITRVILKLDREPQLKLAYGDIKATLQQRGINNPTIKDVSDTIIRIRQQKLPDPAVLGNAGSFFKNPAISPEKAEELINLYPQIPLFPLSDRKAKISAGWLIEQCGYKGYRTNDAGVHRDHALVLVNHGRAAGQEIKQLADEIVAKVLKQFGVQLEVEVNII